MVFPLSRLAARMRAIGCGLPNGEYRKRGEESHASAAGFFQSAPCMVAMPAGQDTLYATVSVLRAPAYRRLWVSGLFSNMARWMDLVAVGWIALQMTGSPFMVAVAAFARSAPMMVLGPFAGIVADRVSRAHLLLVTQAGGAVIALAFLAMFAVDAAGYWPLVALEGAFGILWSLDFPGAADGALQHARRLASGAGRVCSKRC